MFKDVQLSYIEETLIPIDSLLTKVNTEINGSNIWDVGSLCDRGEYLIGLGSVLCSDIFSVFYKI